MDLKDQITNIFVQIDDFCKEFEVLWLQITSGMQ